MFPVRPAKVHVPKISLLSLSEQVRHRAEEGVAPSHSNFRNTICLHRGAIAMFSVALTSQDLSG